MPLRQLVPVASVIWSLAAAAFAQDLAVEATSVDGLPGALIHSIAEDAQGQVWFCGQESLWRMDGSDVEPVAPPGKNVPFGRVLSMVPAADAGVLLGQANGLTHAKSGVARWLRYSDPALHQVRCMLEVEGGRMWGLSESCLSCMRADGRIEREVEPPPGRLLGMALHGPHSWLWTERGLWRGGVDFAGLSRVATFEVRAAAARPGCLIFATSDRVGRVPVGGDVEWLAENVSVREIVAGPDCTWLRSGAEVFFLGARASQLRRVQLFSDKAPRVGLALRALAIDRRGDVWVGHALGALRLRVLSGVQNFVLPTLAGAESVGAIRHGPEGRIWLATIRGRLLRERVAGCRDWIELEVPEACSRISTIEWDADGCLVIGGYAAGAWRRGAAGWERLGGAGVSGVGHLLRRGAGLLGCGVAGVWCEHPGGRFGQLIVDRRRPRSSHFSPRHFAVSGGQLWLATSGSGLFRLDSESGRFVHAALSEGVATVVPDADGVGVLCATRRDVWAVRGAKLSRVPVRGAGLIRSIGVRPDGALWVSRSDSLCSVERGVTRVLHARDGSHPLGYSFGAHDRCLDGSLLFGANGGFSWILPEASAIAAERRRIRSSWVEDSGSPGVRHLLGGDALPVVRGDAFRVHVDVDARGGPGAHPSVELHDLASERVLRADADDFFPGEAGRYRALVTFVESTEAERTVELGVVRVTGTSAGWFEVHAVGVLVSILGLWLTRLRRRGRGPHPFEELAGILGDSLEEVLDVAFLVASSLEAFPGSFRYAAWIQAEDGNRALFCSSNVRERVARSAHAEVLRDGQMHGGDVRVIRRVSNCVAALTLEAGSDLRFEMVAWTKEGDPVGAARSVLQALEPARLAASRRTWLQRLQSYCVKTGVSMEAGLHDLRSPLAALRLGLDELCREQGARHPMLQALSSSADNLLEAVERIGSQRVLRGERHDVAEIVREVVEAFLPRARDLGGRIRLEVVQADGCGACVDRAWLRRVFENVIGNALKYGGEGNDVAVRVEPAEGHVLVTVEDQGPGFRPEDLDYIFLLGGVGASKPAGNESQGGIGLWMSRQAVGAMGGTIRVASAPTGGAKLCIRLPRVTDA